jgi:hypothetical protein
MQITSHLPQSLTTPIRPFTRPHPPSAPPCLQFLEQVKDSGRLDGTTAVVALFLGPRLYVANGASPTVTHPPPRVPR